MAKSTNLHKRRRNLDISTSDDGDHPADPHSSHSRYDGTRPSPRNQSSYSSKSRKRVKLSHANAAGRSADGQHADPLGASSGSMASSTTCASAMTSATTSTSASTSTPTNGSSSSSGQNVKVVARVRPLSKKELAENAGEVVKATRHNNAIQVHGDRNFQYDVVFDQNATQAGVYEETVGDLVQTDIFNGFNVTVLAYGQTGAGKTFTMGSACAVKDDTDDEDGDGDGKDASRNDLAVPGEMDGVIPRAVYDLFRKQQELEGDRQVTVEMSYLEIYNEEARDLLNQDPVAAANLHIRDSRHGVYVQNLSWVPVQSPKDVNKLMESASQRRATASTQMNAVSSRSHAICTLRVAISGSSATIATSADADSDSTATITDEHPAKESTETPKQTKTVEAKLTLVDLAGSERIKRTGAEGNRMKEGININKGLFVLGQVVSCLAEVGQRSPGGSSGHTHVPYRSSKLTRLLQDSLGGNSRTVMVACVSPAETNVEESTNTLRYAQRARNIKNLAVKNVIEASVSAEVATALRQENQALKSRIVLLESMLKQSNGAKMQHSLGGSSLAEAATLAASGLASPQLAASSPGMASLKNPKDVITTLHMEIASLRSKVEQLEIKAQQSAADALTISLRADSAQEKMEMAVKQAKEQGVKLELDLASDNDGQEKSNSASLRIEVQQLKSRLAEAIMEAEVARSTAASIVVQRGNLKAVETSLLHTPDFGTKDGGSGADGTDTDEHAHLANQVELTSELANLTEDIEKKQEMIQRANQEQECMDKMRTHFLRALERLNEEEKALFTQKEDAIEQLKSERQKSSTKRSANTNSKISAESKLQKKVKQLETKIQDLKSKVASHKKCLRLKQMAETKCSKLSKDIENDKKRRAALQKKLKEQTEERRSERKEAKKQAAKLVRDSTKLKMELQKVRDNAKRQADALRKKLKDLRDKDKADHHASRSRRNHSGNTDSKSHTHAHTNSHGARSTSSRGASPANGTSSAGHTDELASSVDNALATMVSLQKLRTQLEQQQKVIEEVQQRRTRSSSVDAEDATSDSEMTERNLTVHELRKNIDAIEQSMNESRALFRFNASSERYEMGDKGVSTDDLNVMCVDIFRRLVFSNIRNESMETEHATATAQAVQTAVSKERKRNEEQMLHLQIEQAEEMASLLDSTRNTLEVEMKAQLSEHASNEDVAHRIHELLQPYWEECDSVAANIRMCLHTVQERQASMESIVNEVAETMISNTEKRIVKKKQKQRKHPSAANAMMGDGHPVSFRITDGDHDAGANGDDYSEDGDIEDHNDSDWSPDTPGAKAKKPQGKQLQHADLQSIQEDISVHNMSIDGALGEESTTSKTSQLAVTEDKENKAPAPRLKPTTPHDPPRAKLGVLSGGPKKPTLLAVEPAAPSQDREASLDTLKVIELKNRLRSLGLKVSGKKSELKDRLRAHYSNSNRNSSGSGSGSIKATSHAVLPRSHAANPFASITSDEEPKETMTTSGGIVEGAVSEAEDENGAHETPGGSSRNPLAPLDGNKAAKRSEQVSYMQQTKTSAAKRLSQTFFVTDGDAEAPAAFQVSRRTRRRKMTAAVNNAMQEFSKLDALLEG